MPICRSSCGSGVKIAVIAVLTAGADLVLQSIGKIGRIYAVRERAAGDITDNTIAVSCFFNRVVLTSRKIKDGFSCRINSGRYRFIIQHDFSYLHCAVRNIYRRVYAVIKIVIWSVVNGRTFQCGVIRCITICSGCNLGVPLQHQIASIVNAPNQVITTLEVNIRHGQIAVIGHANLNFLLVSAHFIAALQYAVSNRQLTVRQNADAVCLGIW